jgi:hypothetical protein
MQRESEALVKLEKETLKTISEIGKFADLGTIYDDAKTHLGKSNWFQRGGFEAHLGFDVYGGIRADKNRTKKRRRIDVSGLVVSSKLDNAFVTTHASYSVVLCDGEDPKTSKVLRKFHFDYEAANTRNIAEPKPTTHLQICGKFSNHHTGTIGYQPGQIEAWYPGFEKPRIPIQPTCLALLLDWIFLEFHTDVAIAAILKDQQWRSLVRKAERQVLLPYFREASHFLEGATNADRSFLRSHQYEMT